MSGFSDEVLMAFADGELDAATHDAVVAAMRDDPAIERRVAQHRSLRSRVSLAYSADLQASPPERLLLAARGVKAGEPLREPTGKVTSLADARAARGARMGSALARDKGWFGAVSIAASLLLGAGLSYGLMRRSGEVLARDGGWVAGGRLSAALSTRTGTDPVGSSGIRVGLSYASKGGDLCRVFSMPGNAASAGVACRRRDSWQIQVLANAGESVPAPGSDAYRTAGSDLPRAILDAVQQEIAGEPFDPAAEEAARRRDWQPAAP